MNTEPNRSLITTRIFGKKFIGFSIFIIILTGLGVIFFDHSDDSKIPGFFLNMQNDSSTVVTESDSVLLIDTVKP